MGQDSIRSVIGTVSVETYDRGEEDPCDCAFVEIDSGSRTMSPDVYWDWYYPTSVADAQVMDYVKIYGKSGKTFAYVTKTCMDVQDTMNTTLKCVVIINKGAKPGDSGAMVAQTFDPTPEFHGMFVAYSPEDDASVYVKHSEITSNIPGLKWDFG